MYMYSSRSYALCSDLNITKLLCTHCRSNSNMRFYVEAAQTCFRFVLFLFQVDSSTLQCFKYLSRHFENTMFAITPPTSSTSDYGVRWEKTVTVHSLPIQYASRSRVVKSAQSYLLERQYIHTRADQGACTRHVSIT